MTTVSELIDPVTGGWDEQLVRDTFWDMDANLILAIPVNGALENKAAWHFDKKANF